MPSDAVVRTWIEEIEASVNEPPPAPAQRLAGETGDEAYARERAPYFRRPVARPQPAPGTGARDLLLAMHAAGGPLHTLGAVYAGWEEMLGRANQTVWLAAAGAYIPFGLGATMRTLLERRFVDVLVTTPAQLTHDLTEVRGLHHYQGSESVDDDRLQRLDVNRYWNVFGDEQELNTNDDLIAEFAATLATDRTYTAAEYFYRLGRWLETSAHRRRGRHAHGRRPQRGPHLLPQPRRRRRHQRPGPLPQAHRAPRRPRPGEGDPGYGRPQRGDRRRRRARRDSSRSAGAPRATTPSRRWPAPTCSIAPT